MEVTQFLEEMVLLYPPEQKDPFKIKSILSIYAEHLLREIQRTGKRYDFLKLSRYIQRNYKYQKFPTIPSLLEFLPYGEIYNESFSGNEGKVIKRKYRGVVYEFTIVPNHWEGVKTIEQLDREIALKTAKEGI